MNQCTLSVEIAHIRRRARSATIAATYSCEAIERRRYTGTRTNDLRCRGLIMLLPRPEKIDHVHQRDTLRM